MVTKNRVIKSVIIKDAKIKLIAKSDKFTAIVRTFKTAIEATRFIKNNDVKVVAYKQIGF